MNDTNLLTKNCVYKIIAEDGYYKIGHTTRTLCERYSGYLRKSNEIIFPHLNSNVHFEVLFQSDDESELKLHEQIEIYKHLSNEIGDKIKHKDAYILSKHFKDKGLKICNRKFDNTELVHRYMLSHNLY